MREFVFLVLVLMVCSLVPFVPISTEISSAHQVTLFIPQHFRLDGKRLTPQMESDIILSKRRLQFRHQFKQFNDVFVCLNEPPERVILS